MAKRKAFLTKRRLAMIFAAGVAVGVAGYIVLDRMAQSRAEAALAKVQRGLPDDARLTYTQLDASFITRSATLNTVIVQMGPRQIRANTLTVADVGETSGGNLRAGDVTARGITAQTGTGARVNARTARLSDLVVAPDGRTLRALGKASVDRLSLGRGEASVRVADLRVRDVRSRRIGRIDANVVEMRGMTDGGRDREVLRGVRIDGLNFAAVPPLPRSKGLSPAKLAAMIRELTYDAVSIRTAELYRGEERRLMLRGLKSRRLDTQSPARAWSTSVDEFAVRVDAPRMEMADVLDDDDMLRGNASGRQVYDPKAGTLAFTDMALEVLRAGRLNGELRLAGLPKGARASGVTPDRRSLARAELAKIDIVYEDQGILDSVLSALAARAGMSRDALIERRLGALKRVAEGAPPDVRKSVAALGEFVRNGGAIRLRADPAGGVSMSRALMKLTFQPVAAASNLNLRLSRP